jgi:hypothetical protein
LYVRSITANVASSIGLASPEFSQRG